MKPLIEEHNSMVWIWEDAKEKEGLLRSRMVIQVSLVNFLTFLVRLTDVTLDIERPPTWAR